MILPAADPSITDTPAATADAGASCEARYRAAVAAAAARDEALAMLAHDLRNPLNALAVSAEVLKRVGDGAPQVQGPIAVIARQVARLAELIDTRLPVRGRLTEAAGTSTTPSTALRVAVIDTGSSAADLRQALEVAGHRVVVAERAADGLALLRSEPPDVAWVSIELPDAGGGCEFARRARAGGYRGRLVAVADHRLAADPQVSLAAGFEAHLARPVPPQLLARLLAPP